MQINLYISFREKNGNWGAPENLGNQINSKSNELSPWVSYDGQYLFFSSTRSDTSGTNKNHSIFIVNTALIENLNPKSIRSITDEYRSFGGQ